MGSIVSGGCFQFKIESTGGYWSWSVRADNTQGLGQYYFIENVYTPYGPLFNTQIPIPGDVITSMSDSLTEIRNQLAPMLALVNPSTTSFILTITEGDANVSIGSVEIQNVGAFGSFMTATATPSVSWLTSSPSSLDSIGKNETGSFNLTLLTTTLLNANSPYSGVINLQDQRTPPTIIPITVSVVVLPRPVISVDLSTVNLTYILLTGTPGSSQAITVQNVGPSGSQLSFTAAKVDNVSWLTVTPTSGGPLNSGSTDQVTFSLVSSAVPQAAGVYSETVRISSSNASNSPVDISIILTVT